MKAIVTVGDPVLRAVAAPVPAAHISSVDIQHLIRDMQDALAAERFGVAIAAPQIGASLRIFIVSGKVFASYEEAEYTPEAYPDRIFINPEVLKASRKQRVGNEGCLSVPLKYGPKVMRSEKVTIRFLDEHGKEHEHGTSDFLAQIYQHEIDHLNGILYIDYAQEVIDVDEHMNPLD